MTRPLTDTEQALLGIWQRWPGLGERDRRANAYAELGLSETRATQILNGLLSREAAWRYDPVTVARLRRLRDSRVGTTWRGSGE